MKLVDYKRVVRAYKDDGNDRKSCIDENEVEIITIKRFFHKEEKFFLFGLSAIEWREFNTGKISDLKYKLLSLVKKYKEEQESKRNLSKLKEILIGNIVK